LCVQLQCREEKQEERHQEMDLCWGTWNASLEEVTRNKTQLV
jgi:hypothetical protein